MLIGDADSGQRLLKAVWESDIATVRASLESGANPNVRDMESGLTAVMIAAGKSTPTLLKVLMDAGADIFVIDSRAGTTALHKACQGGCLEAVALLLEAGLFVDSVASTTGHTPLMDGVWFKRPEIVHYLLDRGAGLNLSTHYGFSLLEHLQYALSVNVVGKEKLVEADSFIRARLDADAGEISSQELMKAVTDGNLETTMALLARGGAVDERAPATNGFNDHHTPLLVACRDGHTAIAAELLEAGADVNAIEPTFLASPLHKAVYNGHADITRLLVGQSGINVDYQGGTNGYTALHDSLWHGYRECAAVLVDAGARLDLRGHDSKLPVDLAVDTFGEDDEMVKRLRTAMRSGGRGEQRAQ